MDASNDDKLILNGEMFLCLRSYIRQKKANAETIAKLEDLIREGADINACDKNDNNNTILHIATQNENKEVVIYLIEKGAHLFSNSQDKTPLHCALQKNTALGKEIAEILSRQGKPAARIRGKSLSTQQSTSNVSNQNSNSVLSSINDQDIPYQKRGGTSGVSGQFYETKLLSLVLHRALHDAEIEQFYLAANIRDIGDFDDVCFRYGNVACFMQTKHRENTDKAKLTVASVRSSTGKLGLGMYFDSFLKIRQKFSPTASDPMFQGKFEDIECYFILYTPLKESFERKLLGNRKICNKLHNIIFTKENKVNKQNKSTDMFQFDYENRDLDFLTRFIKYEHLKILGKTFLEFILSTNKLGVMMTNDLIKIYHPALAHKVIYIYREEAPQSSQKTKTQTSENLGNHSSIPNYIHKARFRPDFFYTEDDHLVTLRDTFYKEIVYTHSPKTVLSKEEVKQTIKEIQSNPCAITISKMIGSPIIFDESNDKLILDTNKLNVVKEKYKQDEIQKMKYDLQKISVSKTMIRDAVYLAGQRKLEILEFQLPLPFGNIDLKTNQKNIEGVHKRLDFLAGKLHSLINHFSKRNENKSIKMIDIDDNVVGSGKILELSHLSPNGGIGGTVGNLLKFDPQSELFSFDTEGHLEENAKFVLEALKKLTGEDLTSYRINVNIDSFPRVSFNIYQYDKKIAAEFMSKLWFYTNQAQEESVETTIKEEINLHYNANKNQHQFLFHVHSDAIFLRFHDEVQKWWKKQTDVHYLTKNTLIFKNAKKDIVDSPLLTVLNVMFIRKIKQLDVEFTTDAIDCLRLDKCLSRDTNVVVHIVSDAVILTAAKIIQCRKMQSNYSFINLDYIHLIPQSDYETMKEELVAMKDMTLVMISEMPLNEGLERTLINIINTFNEHSDTVKKQIIIITGNPITEINIFQNYDYSTIKDDNVNFIDLTPQSQKDFLDKYNITYQGQDVKLNSIIDETSKEFINAKLLWLLLNKEKVEIGHTLETHQYNEIKNYYINRNLKRDGENYAVSTFDDLDEKVVLISSKPCMGKSILLTHLSLQTKQVNPKLWVVRINMFSNEEYLNKMKDKNINDIMHFLSKAALKNFDEIKSVNFSEIDDETISIEVGMCKVSFELLLFVHFYNSGNIIFLFDGFDKIYPQNTNEGLEILTTLKQANKRLWITSDCYVIKILEQKLGSSYHLDRLSTIQQKSFLERFWSTNLQLEKLNHEQLNNIAIFFDYIFKMFNRQLNIGDDINDRPIAPILSVPLHVIYLTILNYFKNEDHSLSPSYFREIIKKKWRLDSYTAVDRYLRIPDGENCLELSGTPLHMYIAANYFAFQITDRFDLNLNSKMIEDRANVYINAVTIYERFLKVNIKNICEIENKTEAGNNQDVLRNKFFQSHKKLALYAIFKESDVAKILTPQEIREVKNTIQMIECGEIKTELIDSVVDGIPRFYHFLFAEYFVVEFLSDMLRKMRSKNLSDINIDSFWDFLVNTVLFFSPPSLRQVFEYKLQYDPELAEVASNENCGKIIFSLLTKQDQAGVLDPIASNADNALKVAINEGLVNIKNFLMKSVQRKFNISEDKTKKLTQIVKSGADILTALSIIDQNTLSCIGQVDAGVVLEVINSNETVQHIQDKLVVKLDKVRKVADSVVEASRNNENVKRLMDKLPAHLPEFIRQLKNMNVRDE